MEKCRILLLSQFVSVSPFHPHRFLMSNIAESGKAFDLDYVVLPSLPLTVMPICA